MNIDITNILNGKEKELDFESEIKFKEEDIKITTMKNLTDCFVKGHLIEVEENVFNISFTLSGTMIMEDSISLENIPYKFSVTEENDYEVGDYLKINDNMLDIYEVLWENVVLEIPIRIVKDNSLTELEGNGWSLNKEVKSNSELGELSKLLDMEGKNEN